MIDPKIKMVMSESNIQLFCNKPHMEDGVFMKFKYKELLKQTMDPFHPD